MSTPPFDYTVEIDFADDPATTTCECEDCGWSGMASELAPIESCSLTPGDPSPAGRCPDCDTLAYVVRP